MTTLQPTTTQASRAAIYVRVSTGKPYPAIGVAAFIASRRTEGR